MTGREVLRVVRRRGCEVTAGKGSHHKVKCPGGCATVVAVHQGQDIPRGTLRAIIRHLQACLGDDWHLG